MRYSIIIPALFAASTFAAPAVHYVTDVQIVKVTVTAGTPEASAAAAAQQAPKYPAAAPVAASYPKHKPKHHHKPKHSKKPVAAPAPVQTYVPAPVQTYKAAPAPVVTYTPAPVEKPQPKPKPVASTPSSGSSSSGNEILDVFNKYRAKYNMQPAVWSQSLADNAYATGKGGDGHEQKHILPTLTKAGSCAQVITPGANEAISGYGSYSPFEVAYLSWLCEVSTDPQIQSDCPTVMKANAMTYLDTAHHDDLVNKEYNQIGCAFYPNKGADLSTPWRGLWTCSLES